MAFEIAERLASQQNGVVAGWQMLSVGMSRQQLYRLRRSARWEDVGSDVFRPVSHGCDRATRVTAAVLCVGAGSFLSHESAAAWWGHRGCRLEGPVHVTTQARNAAPASSTRVFRTERVDLRWVTTYNGVSVARPELVAMQLFAVRSYQSAARVVDRLWAMRLLTGRSLALLLTDMGRRGRNGTAGLRAFLDHRGRNYRPAESGVESRTEEILHKAGIPVRRQVDLGGEHNWSGRVDFLHDSLPLVLEVQSALYHSSLTDREADLERIRRLEADGFVVVEVTDEQVWTRPASVVSAVRAAIERNPL